MNPQDEMAFPIIVGERDDFQSAGMTLRDWFAGQLMAAMVPPYTVGFFEGPFCLNAFAQHDLAKYVYQLADSLLEARGKC